MADLNLIHFLNLELPSEKSLKKHGHLLEVASGRNQHPVCRPDDLRVGHQAVAEDESDDSDDSDSENQNEKGGSTTDVKVFEQVKHRDGQTKE